MTYHVLIVYRNFLARAENASSHIGLGVNAMHTARCLRKAGVLTDVAGVWTPEQLSTLLDTRPEITHVIIEAPWIPTAKMEAIAWRFPRVRFVLRCHSQIGFLQVEAGAVKLFLEAAKLQDGSLDEEKAAMQRGDVSAVIVIPKGVRLAAQLPLAAHGLCDLR